jgi:hypothetical protein
MSSSSRQGHFSSANFIEKNGFEVLACSRCDPKGLVCIMMEGGKKCSKCARDGKRCDGSGVPLHSRRRSSEPSVGLGCFADVSFLVDRILREQRRLEAEEDSTTDDLLQTQRDLDFLQKKLNERLARLSRLRRQKRMLISKGTKMVQENLANMDAVDESDRVEAERLTAESQVVADVHAMGAVDVIDWSAVGLDFSGWVPSSEQSTSEPAGPGSGGGIVPTSEGSPQNV